MGWTLTWPTLILILRITVRSKELLWPALIELFSVPILFQLIHILNVVATILVVELPMVEHHQ